MMNETLKETALYAKHIALGAKMTPFAGYHMPLQYGSLIEEHHNVRNAVGVFDVSHMGEFMVKGNGALALIQKVCANDASKLQIGQAQYTYLPNDKGGIVDDLLVYKLAEEEYMLVVNAANITKDWDWINQHNSDNVTLEDVSNAYSLLAVQGPKAIDVLQKITPANLTDIKYYHFIVDEIAGIKDVIISATGYTGSGGFELYVPNESAVLLWDAIFSEGESENIKPIGLGARDTLRLEMGYCLYGNDINEETSPLAAGLSWVTKFTKTFINSDALLVQKQNGVTEKLVGFIISERGIPRKDYTICDALGAPIGYVTSGCQSPTLSQGIGLGYVPLAYAKENSEIYIQIRKKLVKALTKKLPFIKK